MRDYYGNTILDFAYDANGQPYSMHYNSTPYFYILNLQGDVIRMVDGNGNTVASYEYDPYGKVISATGSMAEINPLRYRGYYYDQETKLYHLWSRYYDPQTGRFINADGYASTGAGIVGNNMFAYCNNNPVNFGDPSGSLPMRKNTVYVNDGAGGDIGPVGTIGSDYYSNIRKRNSNKQAVLNKVRQTTAAIAESVVNNMEFSVGIGLGLYAEGNVLDAIGLSAGTYVNNASIHYNDGTWSWGQDGYTGITASAAWYEFGAVETMYRPYQEAMQTDSWVGMTSPETYTIFSAAAYLFAGFSIRVGFDVVTFCDDMYALSNGG